MFWGSKGQYNNKLTLLTCLFCSYSHDLKSLRRPKVVNLYQCPH